MIGEVVHMARMVSERSRKPGLALAMKHRADVPRSLAQILLQALTYVESYDEGIERRTGHFGLRAHLAEPGRNVSHSLGHGHPRLVAPKADPLRRSRRALTGEGLVNGRSGKAR